MTIFSTFKDLLKRIDAKFLLYLASLGVGVVGLVSNWMAWVKAIHQQPLTEVVTADKPISQLMVEVTGAVQKPGLYGVTYGDRIGQVITVAGGLSPDADQRFLATSVNLAEVVKDGQKIYIPFQETSAEAIALQQENSRINLNQASAKELEELPGIGSAKAEKIISARPIASLQTLVEQKIISANEVVKIQALTTL